VKVEVSFQIDEEKMTDAVRRLAELVEGSAEEEELEPLLEALTESTRFKVDEEDEE